MPGLGFLLMSSFLMDILNIVGVAFGMWALNHVEREILAYEV